MTELSQEKLKSGDLIARLGAYNEASKNDHDAAEAESAQNENARRRIEVVLTLSDSSIVYITTSCCVLLGIRGNRAEPLCSN